MNDNIVMDFKEKDVNVKLDGSTQDSDYWRALVTRH